jgi:hypothetical protein
MQSPVLRDGRRTARAALNFTANDFHTAAMALQIGFALHCAGLHPECKMSK